MTLHSSPLVFDLFGHTALVDALTRACGMERGRLVVRRFPDDESYVRFETEVAGRDVLLVCNLARPDPVIPALLFSAATAKELGARRVTLVAPYLAYMRQDHRFTAGEAITSRLFADWVCTHVDAVITVDPHLHRYASLDEIYRVPTQVVAAAPALAHWLRAHMTNPVIIGPDAESEQWVKAVAQAAGLPWCVAAKTRNGDRDVTVAMPDLERWRGHAPVILDDIISSGHTMIEAVREVTSAGLGAPVCLAVHAVFADGAHDALLAAGARSIVTTDTLPHATNGVSIAPLLAAALHI